MKLASVLWTSFLIFVNADNDVFEEEDKKKSRGPRAHFPDDVPDAISEKFFSRAGVNADWIPGKIHKIHPDATSFEVGGETVLFDDLVPMDGLFADGAQGFFGDEPEKPEIFIHRSKKSPNVQVMLGANRKILRASNLLPDGNVIDLINIQGHWYGEINAATDVPPDMVGIDMVSFLSCTLHSSFQIYISLIIHNCSTCREALYHRNRADSYFPLLRCAEELKS